MKADRVETGSAEEHLMRSLELKAQLCGSAEGDGPAVEEGAWSQLVTHELRAALERTLLLNLEYALDQRAEQQLWQCGFKAPIARLQAAVARAKSGSEQRQAVTALNTLLDSALGFYTMLLRQLVLLHRQQLNLSGIASVNAVEFGSVGGGAVRVSCVTASVASCRYILQHCLVHMGDISRYRRRPHMAERFYRQALHVAPSSGQPYNQLALLAAQYGARIAAVYHYIGGVSVRCPFPAAAANLDQLFCRLAASHSVSACDSSARMSVADYTLLFLQLHARLHVLLSQPTAAVPPQLPVQLLNDQLSAQLLANSLSADRLVQMLVVNLYSIEQVRSGRSPPCLPAAAVSTDLPANAACRDSCDRRGAFLAGLYDQLIRLLAGTMECMLRCACVVQERLQLVNYPPLAAVKLYLQWLLGNSHLIASGHSSSAAETGAATVTTTSVVNSVETAGVFGADQPLWSYLCHLLDRIPSQTTSQQARIIDADLQLPEDEEVEHLGLVPNAATPNVLPPPPPGQQLQQVEKGETLSGQQLLRCQQLVLLCRQLQQLGVVHEQDDGAWTCRRPVDRQLVVQQLAAAATEVQLPSVSECPAVSVNDSASSCGNIHTAADNNTTSQPARTASVTCSAVTSNTNCAPTTAGRRQRQNVAMTTIFQSASQQQQQRRHKHKPAQQDSLTSQPQQTSADASFETASRLTAVAAAVMETSRTSPATISPPDTADNHSQQLTHDADDNTSAGTSSLALSWPPDHTVRSQMASPATAGLDSVWRHVPEVEAASWPASDPWRQQPTVTGGREGASDVSGRLDARDGPAADACGGDGGGHLLSSPPRAVSSYSLFPTASSTSRQQQMWPLAGVSPLQLLIEQQRNRAASHHPDTNH